MGPNDDGRRSVICHPRHSLSPSFLIPVVLPFIILIVRVVIIIQEGARCHPASRGSQRQHGACTGYLQALCVSFRGWVMVLSRRRKFELPKQHWLVVWAPALCLFGLWLANGATFIFV